MLTIKIILKTERLRFMLKIWYYADIDYMKDAPSYFDNVYEDEWIGDGRCL